MNKLDKIYINCKNRWDRFLEEFKSSELGVSGFVATILLIVIVVALCAIFWENIKTWFTNMWAKITSDTGKIGG